ncbi:LacI family DNA-binding transcriptional regulator [Shinella sp. AETb1-6]|nr:LacI family DNA-binding transcriptional regulator [Shinella sp. AETb1-6]
MMASAATWRRFSPSSDLPTVNHFAVYATGLVNRFCRVFSLGYFLMTTRKITIRDVATAAGVSVSTVSRHLNGRISLPEPTAKRIEQTVKNLSYRPNALARRLTHGKSETLGFITSDIAYPLFAAIASASEAEAAANGYSLLMFNSRNIVDNEIAFLARIDDRQVDGVLLMTNHSDEGPLVRKINQSGNVVLIDEDVPGARAPRLFAENVRGARLAIEHLIAAGHRRIAVIAGPEGLLSTIERLAGYHETMEAAGIEVDPALVFKVSYDESAGSEAFDALMGMADPPTAVFAFADMLAIGAIKLARQRGIRIPDDVSLVSFDDILHAELLDPPLTTVRQSPEDFGRRGINMLLGLIRGEKSETAIQRIAVELVVRKSVCPPSKRGG